MIPTVILLGLLMASLAAPAAERPHALDFSTVGIYGTYFDFCDFGCYKVRVSDKPDYLSSMAKRISDIWDAGKLNLVGLYCFDRIRHSRPIEEYVANADRMLAAMDLTKVHAFYLNEENVYWNKGLEILNALYDHVKARADVPVYQWYSMPLVHHPKQKADGWIIDPYGMRRDAFRRYLMKFLVLGKPVINCQHGTPQGRFAGKIPDAHTATQEQIDVCREFNVPMFFYCVDNERGSPSIWLTGNDPELVKVREWILGEIKKIRAIDVSKLPLPTANTSVGQPIPVAGDAQNRFVFEDTFGDLRRRSFIDDASIDGFLMLRWDGGQERLHVKSKQGGRDRACLTWHFTSEFEMSGIAAALTGFAAAGSKAVVSLSFDGQRFENGTATAKAGAFELTAKADGTTCKEFWVRVEACVAESPAEPVAFDTLRVACGVKPPEARVIALVPDERGRVVYTDDFQCQKYLHLAEIESPQELEWERGLVGIHGMQGKIVSAEIKQRFTCAQPLSDLRLKADLCAHRSLGAFNTIGLSLDGKEPLITETTRGREDSEGKTKGRFKGVLEIDASKDARFAGVREFCVHLNMTNTAGKPTNRSNYIRSYTVEAEAQEPAGARKRNNVSKSSP